MNTNNGWISDELIKKLSKESFVSKFRHAYKEPELISIWESINCLEEQKGVETPPTVPKISSKRSNDNKASRK